MGLKCHLFKLKIKEEPMLTFEKSKNNILYNSSKLNTFHIQNSKLPLLRRRHPAIYNTPTNFGTAIATLQTCLTYVQSWMTTNKLNLDKTEFILFGNKSQRERLASPLLIY